MWVLFCNLLITWSQYITRIYIIPMRQTAFHTIFPHIQHLYANQLLYFIEPFYKLLKPLILTTKLNFSEHFSWGAGEYHIISPVFQTVDTSIMFGHEMLLATFYIKWMVCGLGDSLLCWTDESLSCHAICISLKVPLSRSDYICCQLTL